MFSMRKVILGLLVIFLIIVDSCSNNDSSDNDTNTDTINYDDDNIRDLNNATDAILSEQSKVYHRTHSGNNIGIIGSFTYSVSYGNYGSSGSYSYSYTYTFYSDGRYSLYYNQSVGTGVGSNGYSLSSESGTFTLFSKNDFYYITIKNLKGSETTYRYMVSEKYLFFLDANNNAKECTITFISNTNTDIEETQFFWEGLKVRLSSIKEIGFSLESYIFDCWNTNKDGSGTKYSDCEVFTPAEELILYAQWKKACTLSFSANNSNATGNTESITVKCGDNVEVSKCGFTLYGNNFLVWNTELDGSGTSYEDGMELQLNDDLILYAKWCESLSESIIIENIAGKEYAYFGNYPQSVLPIDSNITIDEENSFDMGANTYYLGSDGNWYARVLENACSTENEYSDKTKVSQASNGSIRYFKVEPIKWRVLKTNSKYFTLLAENILTANIEYYGGGHRTLDSYAVRLSEYKYSNIRAYLNGIPNQYITDGGDASSYDIDWSGKGFLQTAFTDLAQEKIKTTYASNSADTTVDANAFGASQAYGSETTADKIFLLCKLQATNRNYGFSSASVGGDGSTRIKIPTDYAKANYASSSSDSTKYGGIWWLRSPYYGDSSFVQAVDTIGCASARYSVTSKFCGIVPALTIEPY